MNEGEMTKDMYRRLTALGVAMMGFGASYDDDNWFKRKFYNTFFFP
jgi:hypothetical protein